MSSQLNQHLAASEAFLWGTAPSAATLPEPCVAALDCANRGWAVLPCEPNGKLPDNRLVAHGVNSATKDPEIIKKWFAAYPDINYAVAGGDDSNLSFYDYDDLYDDDKNVDYSESQFPELHKSFRVRSGRILKPGQVGGFHLYAAGACQSRALFADAALPLITRPGVKKDGSPLLDKNGNPIMQTFDNHDRLVVNGRVTIGEVRSRGEYVIGYDSHHKSGRDYELVVDASLFPNPIQDVKVVSNTPAIGTEQQNKIAGYVEEAFGKTKIEYKARQDYLGGIKWLVACPWEYEHTGGKNLAEGGSSSAVFMSASGALGYRCLHAHCQSSRNWEQFRAHLQSLAGHKLSFKAKGQPKGSEQNAETFVEPGTRPTSKTKPRVEEYIVATTAVLKYPQMGNDMISQYARLLTQGTGIPYGHVRECLKNVFAFCLSDDTHYPNHEKLYARGWHFCLGDPESGKTTALTCVLDRWAQVLIDLGIWVDKLSSYGSLQYLTKGFQDHERMMLYVTEGNTLATANEHIPAIFGGLSDLYDQPIISAGSYRNKSAKCAKAKGSALVCITPDDFLKAMQGKGVIGGGVLPRWTASDSEVIVVDGEWAIPNEGALNILQEKIKDRFNGVRVVETDAARAIRIALTTEMARPEAGRHAKRLIEYYKRECLLAAVFAEQGPLGENIGVITKDIAEWTATWARYQLHLRITYWPIDAGNDVERMCSAMRGLLKRAHPKGVSLAKLKDTANVYREGSGGIEVFGRAYRAMMANEDMRKVGENAKGKSLFGLVTD